MFDETYYRCNNYTGYLERWERYQRMISELHLDLLQKVSLDFREGKVLDYGCAVGFVSKALVGLGYRYVKGFDVSSWAVDYGHNVLKIPVETLTTNIADVLKQRWDLTFALDVLEHIPRHQLMQTLRKLDTHYLLVRIPLTLEDDGKFVLDVSERDPTHITRLTRSSWNDLMTICGYDWLFNTNLSTFYDSTGVMCSMFRKRNKFQLL